MLLAFSTKMTEIRIRHMDQGGSSNRPTPASSLLSSTTFVTTNVPQFFFYLDAIKKKQLYCSYDFALDFNKTL